MPAARKRLGELLVEAGAMDAAGVNLVVQQQRVRGDRFGRTAVEMGLVTEEVMVKVLSAQLGVGAAQADQLRAAPALLQTVPRDVAHRFQAFPLGFVKDGGVDTLVVASPDPADTDNINALQTRLGRRVKAVLAGERAIARAIQTSYASELEDPARTPAPAGPAAPLVPVGRIRAVPSTGRSTGAVVLPPTPAMPPAATVSVAPSSAARGAALFSDTEMLEAATVRMNTTDIPVDFDEPTRDGSDEPLPASKPDAPPADAGDDVDMDMSAEPGPAAGSVFTTLPVRLDATGLQVRALIKQGLVDDVLIWVFIDKGIVNEDEVVRLRGGKPLAPRA